MQDRVAEPGVHDRKAADRRAAELNRYDHESGRIPERRRAPGDVAKLHLDCRQLQSTRPRHGVETLIVQTDGLQLEGVGDMTGNRPGYRNAAIGKKESTAERVQPFQIALSPGGVDFPLARASRQLARNDRGREEGHERHPVLWIGDGECLPEAGRRN